MTDENAETLPQEASASHAPPPLGDVVLGRFEVVGLRFEVESGNFATLIDINLVVTMAVVTRLPS